MPVLDRELTIDQQAEIDDMGVGHELDIGRVVTGLSSGTGATQAETGSMRGIVLFLA